MPGRSTRGGGGTSANVVTARFSLFWWASVTSVAMPLLFRSYWTVCVPMINTGSAPIVT